MQTSFVVLGSLLLVPGTRAFDSSGRPLSEVSRVVAPKVCLAASTDSLNRLAL